MERATRNDVARRAAVSSAVVSYVLNGTGRAHRISEATCRRVLAASRALGYQPNIWGRVLKTQRSHLFALFTDDLTDPVAGELASGIGQTAHDRGFGLMVFDLRGQDLRKAPEARTLETSMADAFILHVGCGGPGSRVDRDFFGGKPFCVVGRHAPGTREPSVEVDNALGAELAARRLLACGVRRVGIVADRGSYAFSRARLAGCRKVFHGARWRAARVYHRGETQGQYEAGAAAVRAWLEAGPLPDGIFAMGDVMAMGALSALHLAGVACPGQVKLVGFDGTPMAAYAAPPLTTVRQPFARMAETAVEFLLTLRAGRRIARPHVLLPPELVVRASA